MTAYRKVDPEPIDEAAIKLAVRRRVHQLADAADWAHLSAEQRRDLYERWSVDPAVGGVLARVMQGNQVRVYIKDTLMKSYFRARRTKLPDLLRAMAIPCDKPKRRYTAPTAILCEGPALYTLTAAKHWKVALINTFERACQVGELSKNLVFIENHMAGRFVDKNYRGVIEAVARRLDLDVHWIV